MVEKIPLDSKKREHGVHTGSSLRVTQAAPHERAPGEHDQWLCLCDRKGAFFLTLSKPSPGWRCPEVASSVWGSVSHLLSCMPNLIRSQAQFQDQSCFHTEYCRTPYGTLAQSSTLLNITHRLTRAPTPYYRHDFHTHLRTLTITQRSSHMYCHMYDSLTKVTHKPSHPITHAVPYVPHIPIAS